MTHQKAKNWAIFCKIVDNFGDIGICWRLAKQLATEYPQAAIEETSIQVTLFIDDLTAAHSIIPALNPAISNHAQSIDSVYVLPLSMADDIPAADVVIETFACDLPEKYLISMESHQSCWINIDYLSAEPWVEDFHAKPSKHPTRQLTKYYFFPGFNAKTGGLIREKALLTMRDTFKQQAYLAHLASTFQTTINSDAINISLFCYPQANLAVLFYALQKQAKPVNIWLPFNNNLTTLSAIFIDFNYTIGEVYEKNNLRIYVLPFLSQLEYDHLLWACDLNFVRGEDSWIRAIWAAKPFVWQPYIQTENTHLKKLNAFLQTHYPENSADTQHVNIMHHADLAWSNAESNVENEEDCLLALLAHLPELQAYHLARTNALAQLPDLTAQLVLTSQKILKK